jgi:hypothetical protein
MLLLSQVPNVSGAAQNAGGSSSQNHAGAVDNQHEQHDEQQQFEGEPQPLNS